MSFTKRWKADGTGKKTLERAWAVGECEKNLYGDVKIGNFGRDQDPV